MANSSQKFIQEVADFAKCRGEVKNYPLDIPIFKFIEEQANRTPDAIALIFEDDVITYEQLNIKANKLANHLIRLGVKPDTLVGVCAERSVELVVGLLGIVKAGGAYVPMDPEYPQERLQYMLNDSNVSILLTQDSLKGLLGSGNFQSIALDGDWPEIEKSSANTPDVRLTPENLIYMIYTSGSTGNPKGVPNVHKALVNRILWMQDEYKLTDKDRVLQKTPFSFDVSVWEFFWPLMTGACLVVAKPGGHRDPNYLVSTIIKHHITTLHFVPSMLSLFLAAGNLNKITSVRQVLCSGEALPYELTKRFFNKVNAKLHNLYGPTEAAIDVTYWECQKESDKKIVPIGFPIANTQLYILDEELNPVTDGEIGELHIGGVGLARGYWNKPELTNEKFIANPFEGGLPERLYKTGDLSRFLPDGSIEYLGRTDFQVKIRGFRIELGEIEAVMLKHEAVLEATVIDSDDSLGEKRLLAYLVLDKDKQLSVNGLREFLLKELPDYMVPASFIFLEAMPLSPNGKVDRKALPKGQLPRPALDQIYIAPHDKLEKTLCEIWKGLLNLEKVGINDNFFDLGGNSLLAMMTVVMLEEQEEINLSLVKLFQYPTVRTLAQYIDANLRGEKTTDKDFDRVHSLAGQNRKSATADAAIVGLSGRFPGAYDVDELWDVLSRHL
jgi:amino acid adenylation domain-containing protein